MHLTWKDLDSWYPDGSGKFYKSPIPALRQEFPPPGKTLDEMKDRLDLLEAVRDEVLDYVAHVAISVNFGDSLLVQEMLHETTARLIAVTGEIVEALKAWCDAAKEQGMWCPPLTYEDRMMANLEAKFPRSVPRPLHPTLYRVRQHIRWGVDLQNANAEASGGTS